MDKKIYYNSEEEPIILSKSILDLLLKHKKPSDLIALYTFYYYTAKWQKTNQIKALQSYVMKGLHWSRERHSYAYNKLIDLGLIEDVQKRNETGDKFGEKYIKINFLWKKKTINDTKENLFVEKPNNREQTENALSTNNKNALSTNNKNDSSFTSTDELSKNIEKIYQHYKEKIYQVRLTKKGKEKIISRLKEYSVDDLLKAIDYFSTDDWYPKNCGWRGMSWFFDREDRVETFLGLKNKNIYKKGKTAIIS